MGWQAWCFKKWACSGRHEIENIENLVLDSETFNKLDWKSILTWALEKAPAATVALGATFSPALWQHRAEELSKCPWCKSHLGTWRHLCWDCQDRPSRLDRPHDWLARFGWSFQTDTPNEVKAIRSWLETCQLEVWSQTHSSE